MARRIGLLLILLANLSHWSAAHAQTHGPTATDPSIVQVTDFTTRMALGQSAFIADLPTGQLEAWLRSPGAELQNLVSQFTDPRSLQSLPESTNSNLNWRRNETDKILLNAPSRVSWIVVDIQYTGSVETTVMLDLTGADGVAWSYRGPLGGQLSYADDFSLPQGGRPVYDANVVIPVRLAPQQPTRLHINVLTVSDEKFVSFDLLSTDQYRAQRLQQTVLDGAYYGLVLALILYNLFLYFALRRRTNLYFCVFAAASAGVIYIGSGLSLVVGVQHPLPLSLPLFYLTEGLMYISGALYSMHLLNIQSRQSRLFRMWALLLLINFLGTLWLVFVARNGGYATDNVSLTFDAITLLWVLNQLVYLVTVVFYWRQSALARLWFVGISIHIWAMGMWPIILNSA